MILTELQQALHTVNPAAVLVSPQVLERVIQQVCNLPALPWNVPHRKSYVVERQDLFRHIEQDDLDLSPEYLLPATVILLVKPSSEQLTGEKKDTLLGVYWRRLFHASVHLALEQSWKNGVLTLGDVRQRIEAIGQTEFNEVRRVLLEDHWIVTSAAEQVVWTEFAAVFLELRYFANNLLPIYFPSLDVAAVEQLLKRDVDAAKLFNDTRLAGVPDPVPPTDTASDESHDYFYKLQRSAERAAETGNLVRAAILHTRAARVAPANLTRSTRAEAEGDMQRLAKRLEKALELTDNESTEWAKDMGSLLDKADQGNRPVEADLLLDLQKVALDCEEGIFGLGLWDWLFTGGRRPIKRPLPAQQKVRVLRHLRSAAQRLAMARLSDIDRRHLGNLIRSALTQSEERLRVKFRPTLEAALKDVGLEPRNPPERTAFYKIIEELLDRIIAVGHLTFGDLRDVISRNQLKLPDLADPQDFLRGDPLLRLDRRLGALLDGVYRPSEIYSRGLERLTALNFGTHMGRLLTVFVTLPFFGAFTVLRGLNLITEYLFKFLAGPARTEAPEPSLLANAHTAELPPPPQSASFLTDLIDPGLGLSPVMNWCLFAFLGFYFMALWHSPPVRRFSATFFRGLGRLLYLSLIEAPVRLARLPLLRRFANSWACQFFYWFIFKPLIVCVLLRLIKRDLFRDYISSSVIFLVVMLLINSSPGRVLGEIISQALVRLSELVRVGLFKGLYNLITTLFKHLVSTVETVLFSIDEWMRFRTGDKRLWMGMRLVLGMFWFPISYIARFYVVVLIEPMLNPLKLPICVLAGKLLAIPLVVLWHWSFEVLTPRLGYPLTWVVVAPIIFLMPDAFGYLFWELKENWGLYKANRSPVVKPLVIGTHGETMSLLLTPGLHSGTIPRLFARWRHAERSAVRTGNWRAARAYRLAVQDLEHTVQLFAMRNLVALVHQSRAWGGGRTPPPKSQCLSVGNVALACSQIRIELAHARYPNSPVWLEFEDHEGWLVAKVQQTGWIAELPPGELQPFNEALVNLYKLAGVDLVREQMEAQLPPGLRQYDINAKAFVLWLDQRHGQAAVYSWRDDKGFLKPRIRGEKPESQRRGTGDANGVVAEKGLAGVGLADGTVRRLEVARFMFREVPLTWQQHVECWLKDQEEGEQPRLVSNGVELDLAGWRGLSQRAYTSIRVLRYQGADAAGDPAFADVITLGNILGGAEDRAVLNHFQRYVLVGGLGVQPCSAEDNDGGMDGNGGLGFRDALVGQPGELLLHQRFKPARELGVVELAGLVAPQMPIESLGQARQDKFHQRFVHDGPGVWWPRADVRRPVVNNRLLAVGRWAS